MSSISTWDLLYTIAKGYPSQPDYQQVQNYREFFEAIRYVIPRSRPEDQEVYSYLLSHQPLDYVINDSNTLLEWIGQSLPQGKTLTVLNRAQFLEYLLDVRPISTRRTNFSRSLVL